MATQYCEQCGMLCIDSPRGRISGCYHYPVDVPFAKLSRREKMLVDNARREWETHDQMEAV